VLGPFLFVRGAEVAVEGLLSTQLAGAGERGACREDVGWGKLDRGGLTFWPQGQALGWQIAEKALTLLYFPGFFRNNINAP
jgi:hypothetical protein